MACSKSRSGKHVWTVYMKEDIFGNQTQYRRCDNCHLRQKYVKALWTGRGTWKTIQLCQKKQPEHKSLGGQNGTLGNVISTQF